jgi:osomolarity two-component system, sensor histidine kinase TcsA
MAATGELPSGDYTRIFEVFAALSPVAGLLLDPSLRVLNVSATYLALFNLTADECIGLNVFELVQAKALSPGVTPLRHVIYTAIDTRALYAKSGIEATDQTFWSLRAVPVFDEDKLLYVALECAEITEEYLKRQAALDTDDTYRVLVETVKDYAIFMLDVKGSVRTWNAGATLLKGYTPDEIIGQHFSTFYSAADIAAEKPQKELETCLRDGKVEDESWRYRKDGSRFWANVIMTSIYREGVHIGYSKVTRDLTERKAVESRLITAYEESAKLKSAFLANISHEIRTPMHGMLSALTLLMDLDLSKEQRELGGIIEESGGVLLQLIDDILDYSKLSSGSFSICSDVISVSDIITSVVRSFQTTLKPEISLKVSLDGDLPKSAQGDQLRYRQIVQNLVSNAVKFTEKGFIHVHASVQRDEGSSFTIRTRVADTGIGIPDCAVGSLFTPFTQFDTSATKRYKGTGLGLSICKSLAELMGGSIGFYRNPEEHGSVFWFDIKVEKLESEKPVNGIPSLQLPPSPDPLTAVRTIAPGKRILLAEDNFINQKVMLMMLKKLGFEQVETATDGVETVRLTTLQKPLRYDLILMDINMPVLDGIGSTREIRKAGLNIPIIAMTANALKGDVDVYLAKGMNDYIPKPVDRQVLMKALLNWLK